LRDKDVLQAHEHESEPVSDWCCMYWVLSLQEDLERRNRCFNVTLKAVAMYVCFCPGSIVNLILSKCFGVSQNIVSPQYSFSFAFDSLLLKVIAMYLMVICNCKKNCTSMSQHVRHAHNPPVLSENMEVYGCLLVCRHLQY
jgi:hypothetical protein